eukprot:TRINITY_DN8465_c0_g1_i16.p1 TRINITY_DN8465_c0_g1~~TRINITY_DN8465_c0_g1_i16.p1  ORF type:complete len:603 (-),score=116.71 TRINITY_DN8465_c0_g1_i16:14-1822(-)
MLRRPQSVLYLDFPRQQIFDTFVIVQFNEASSSKDKRKIVFHHPEQTSKVDRTTQSLPLFCFPEDSLSEHIGDRNCVNEDFSFVLTLSDGSKRFAFCRRYTTREQTIWNPPLCYCVTSRLSSMSLFSELIDCVEVLEYETQSCDASVHFLSQILLQPLLEKGETLTVSVPVQGTTRKLKIQRSSNEDYEYLDHVTFDSVLFRCVPVSHLLLLFEGLLLEKRIILISSKLSHLSSGINALAAIVYPFSWQHVFIPILPRSLIEFVQAPMPFLIGILTSVQPLLEQQKIEEGTIIYHLDQSKIISGESSYEQIVPRELYDLLEQNLNKLVKSDTKGKAFNQCVAHNFLRFWCDVFGQKYRSCFNPEDGSFNKAKFLKSRPAPIRQFLVVLQETQMYDMFIQEREEMAMKGTLDRCILTNVTSGDLKKKVENATSLPKKAKSRSHITSPHLSKSTRNVALPREIKSYSFSSVPSGTGLIHQSSSSSSSPRDMGAGNLKWKIKVQNSEVHVMRKPTTNKTHPKKGNQREKSNQDHDNDNNSNESNPSNISSSEEGQISEGSGGAGSGGGGGSSSGLALVLSPRNRSATSTTTTSSPKLKTPAKAIR